MPFRLIGTIILLLIVTIFAGANLDNRCDINFIFTKVQNVPVFLTAVISFLIGAIIMIPFTFKRKCGKDKKSQNQQNVAAKTQKPSDEEEQKTLFDFKIKRDVNKNQTKDKKEKKSLFGKLNGKNKKSDKAESSQKSEDEKSTDSKQPEKSAEPEKSSPNQDSETEKTHETTSV